MSVRAAVRRQPRRLRQVRATPRPHQPEARDNGCPCSALPGLRAAMHALGQSARLCGSDFGLDRQVCRPPSGGIGRAGNRAGEQRNGSPVGVLGFHVDCRSRRAVSGARFSLRSWP
jgi:hypothetical protein